MYIDAHLHLADYLDCCSVSGGIHECFAHPASFCCSAHDRNEFARHQAFLEQDGFTARPPNAPSCPPHISAAVCSAQKQRVLFSFGIHPQNPVTDEADFLYRLLETKCIQAIGECGFDLFNNAYKQTVPDQRRVWDMQIQWAQAFQLPIVIHCRKALPLIFESAAQLKKLPAVIFHGWGGSPQEAASFLKKGVNAYFSLGKAVLRGQKSVCAMAAQFDIHRLLTETDAPYMRLKDEAFSHPRDIIAVTARCAELREAGCRTGILTQYTACSTALDETHIADSGLAEFLNSIGENFCCAFGLSGGNLKGNL